MLRRVDVELLSCNRADFDGQTIDVVVHAVGQDFQLCRVNADTITLHARQHADQRKIDGVVKFAKALRIHSEGMRVKRMQHAEEKAAMVSVKMTIPLVLCILPSLIAIVMGPAIVMITQSFGSAGGP